VNGRLQEITLHKGVETYVFRFDAASRQALLGVVARFAAAPDLAFSWHDAAVVCKRVREDAERRPEPARGTFAGRFQ
jgi:hypothetical protein